MIFFSLFSIKKFKIHLSMKHADLSPQKCKEILGVGHRPHGKIGTQICLLLKKCLGNFIEKQQHISVFWAKKKTTCLDIFRLIS